MGTPAVKHTNEAIAFITLYKTMPDKVKEEVKEMITHVADDEDARLFTSISLQAWETDEEVSEDKIWEKLYNKHNGV